ncbi:metalloregulator ArsR/SmtB family transcription factor [Fodinisporobacter ferrooxydans]|uniref:Metalloregulator ArsR/SmtB family transcription factor n=1 Tax=Fodinisporobacter ferrooxydans TaxID=2901836 RepID=A0ABY4CLI6_9BACL|nr:metalloregulator ArsR/SmtB family transcription factor [Alicyclobacillaceae bacterium MYW30-H2]
MVFETLANDLKALADPTRLKIVALLKLRDFCVCELVPIFGISQPAISKHLNRLKVSGFVREMRRGQWVFYSLNQEKLASIGTALQSLPDLSEELESLKARGLLVNCD